MLLQVYSNMPSEMETSDFSAWAHAITALPPVLILHGLFGSGLNYSAYMHSQTHPTLAFDLRNHGHSPHACEMNYQVLAADLVESLAAMQLAKVTLIGHSMGGKTAMQLAQTCPELIHRLGILDIAPLAYPKHYAFYANLIPLLLSLDTKNLKSKAEALPILHNQVPVQTAQFLLTNLVPTEQGYQWRVNLGAILEHLSVILALPNLAPVTIPSFFLGGSKSDYIPKEALPVIERLFPGARVEYVNTGHFVPAEDPAGFAAWVDRVRKS